MKTISKPEKAVMEGKGAKMSRFDKALQELLRTADFEDLWVLEVVAHILSERRAQRQANKG